MDRLCKKCGEYIKFWIIIDGKRRNLKNRKFCLTCSPFKSHNTRDITKHLFSRAKSVTKYRRKLKWKLVLYKGGCCEKCGYNKKIPRAYDFHHNDPKEKSFNIAQTYSRSFNVLKEEVDKCQLLCCRCHAELHHELDQLK